MSDMISVMAMNIDPYVSFDPYSDIKHPRYYKFVPDVPPTGDICPSSISEDTGYEGVSTHAQMIRASHITSIEKGISFAEKFYKPDYKRTVIFHVHKDAVYEYDWRVVWNRVPTIIGYADENKWTHYAIKLSCIAVIPEENRVNSVIKLVNGDVMFLKTSYDDIVHQVCRDSSWGELGRVRLGSADTQPQGHSSGKISLDSLSTTFTLDGRLNTLQMLSTSSCDDGDENDAPELDIGDASWDSDE